MNQAVIAIERANKIAKTQLKKQYQGQVEKNFEILLTKVKKGALTKEEKIQARINEEIQMELSKVDAQNLEQNLWVEGWRPECLAFRYFNILQMYKTKYQNSLELHTEIMHKKKPLSDDKLKEFEISKMGFDLTKIP